MLAQTGSSENGLPDEEAVKRLRESEQYKKVKPSWMRDAVLFLNQFKSPLVLMLVGAVILSAIIGEHSDVVIILFILLSMGLLSFIQERSAGRTVEKLQAMIKVKCLLLRNGRLITIASNEIVPDDILLVKAGDIVSADCLLIETNELHANEASLTGESYPVRKQPGPVDEHSPLAKRFNCIWEGSNIVSGSGKAVVVNTGATTVYGGIAKSVSALPSETAFEKGIRHFGFFLMQITLVLAVAILTINLLFHKPLIDSLLFALALAVGMAPELLPAINTIVMSAGAKRMLRPKVIVKKLSAIQNLGEVNLLCTDKTGTITPGAILVAKACDAYGNNSNFVQELACINAGFETGYTNPIDEALKKITVSIPGVMEKIGEIPYDFIRKRLSVGVRKNDIPMLITKGAFKQVLNICTYIRIDTEKIEPLDEHIENIRNLYTRFGNDGFRVLAVCYKKLNGSAISKEDENEMIFAGFILLHDPLKEGLEAALQSLKNLDVQVKIITGDNKIVAESIGRKIGLHKPLIISGDEMQQMSSEALAVKARHADIFAEIEPRQKERIIRSLRKNFIVAYMGDGINDVAAINAADVGISIDNAMDVAKEAADFVLLDRNLLVLADGIREGRKTFINTLKYIFITTDATLR